MILSASRRSDIPAYYAEWFCRRLEAGFLLVRNPVNPHQVSRIKLTPEVLDGIVFWSKNPAPLLTRLDRLSSYPYYIQFTLTPYGADIEPHVPHWEDAVATFLALEQPLGPERIVWRYDPIIFTRDYTPSFHLNAFREIARRLSGRTRRCVLSFLDFYPIVKRQIPGAVEPSQGVKNDLMAALAEIADTEGIVLTTCAEDGNYDKFGVLPGRCIDGDLLGSIGGHPLKVRKASSQRPLCLCSESIDIGTYSTCRHGCLYCYAEKGGLSSREFDPDSPILGLPLSDDDLVSSRKMLTFKTKQLRLF